MTRITRFFTIFVPGLVAGGLLFGSSFGHASSGGDDELWPVGGSVGGGSASRDDVRRADHPRTAQAPRVPPPPPMPPMPPRPPSGRVPPMPPVPPMPIGGGISIKIHDGKIQIDGIDDFARQQIDNVRQMMRNNPNIPPDVRDRVLARMDKARAALDKRLKNLSVDDLDQLDDQMEKMGEELEKAMEGLEADLDKLGDKLGKDFAKKLGKDFAKKFKPGKLKLDIHPDVDHDDNDNDNDSDDDTQVMPSPDVDIDDAHDMAGAMHDLRDITLKPDQRDRIVRLRADMDKNVAAAKKQLDDASQRLETALEDVNARDADIVRYVDQITTHEAAIRKARLLTWVQARRVLDSAQRTKIEGAAKKHHK